jgi:hypothetical protein
MYYREWCSKPNLRKGRMLPLEALALMERTTDPGYCSVYMFSEADAEAIASTGTSKGMNKYPVHSDMIYIDIDTGETEARRACKILKDEGLGYSVYSSGGKGYHIVVGLDKVYSGFNVPYSQRKWVEKREIACDMSLYQAGRLISMPGRIHPVTKARKTLLATVTGKPAVLELIDPPAPKFDYSQGDDTDSLKLALVQLSIMANNPPAEGNRHTSLWSVAKSLSEGGLSLECSVELLTLLNDSWPTPKDASEVERAVVGAYGETI